MFKQAAILTLAVFAVTACTGTTGGVVGSRSSDRLSPFYAPSLVSYEAQDGRFPLVVRGNPFGGVPQAQLEQTLHRDMRTPAWAPRAQFVRDDRAEAGDGLRLVVVFNPVTSIDFRAICGDVSGVGSTGPGNQTTIRMAFCDGPQTMSDVTYRFGSATDYQSATFIGALNNSVARALPFVDVAGENL